MADNLIGKVDKCRHCGTRIVFRNTDSEGWSRADWWHEPARSPELFRECKNTADDGVRRRVATPTAICWEGLENSYNTHCGRAVKDKELLMCGIHARFAREAREREDAWAQQWEQQAYITEETTKLIARLKTYGVEAKLDHSGIKDGQVVVDPSELLDLLERLHDQSPG